MLQGNDGGGDPCLLPRRLEVISGSRGFVRSSRAQTGKERRPSNEQIMICSPASSRNSPSCGDARPRKAKGSIGASGNHTERKLVTPLKRSGSIVSSHPSRREGRAPISSAATGFAGAIPAMERPHTSSSISSNGGRSNIRPRNAKLLAQSDIRVLLISRARSGIARRTKWAERAAAGNSAEQEFAASLGEGSKENLGRTPRFSLGGTFSACIRHQESNTKAYQHRSNAIPRAHQQQQQKQKHTCPQWSPLLIKTSLAAACCMSPTITSPPTRLNNIQSLTAPSPLHQRRGPVVARNPLIKVRCGADVATAEELQKRQEQQEEANDSDDTRRRATRRSTGAIVPSSLVIRTASSKNTAASIQTSMAELSLASWKKKNKVPPGLCTGLEDPLLSRHRKIIHAKGRRRLANDFK